MFFKYAAIGGFVGLLALMILAISERVLSESKTTYLISVLVVYASGIVLNYVLQKTFTFGDSEMITRRKSFFKFVAVALIGALCTTGLSYVLRYQMNWPGSLGGAEGPTSFMIACLASSAITFYLNKTWVFKT